MDNNFFRRALQHMNHPLDRILDERKMTDAEMDKREKIVKSLKKKKGEFESRYGKDAKEVMYATATKMAMGEDIDEKTKMMGDLHRIEKTREGYQLFVYSPYTGKFIAQGPPHKSKKDAEKDAMAYEETIQEAVSSDPQGLVKGLSSKSKKEIADQLNRMNLSGYGDYMATEKNVHKFQPGDLMMAMLTIMKLEDVQLDEKVVKARVGFINRRSRDVVNDLRDAKKRDLMVSAQEAPGSRTDMFDITFASDGQFKEFMDSYDVMLVDMLDEAFKPHKMYDPKTGEEVDAKTKADHLRYKAMGYTHDKPKLDEKMRLRPKRRVMKSTFDGVEPDSRNWKKGKASIGIHAYTSSGMEITINKGQSLSYHPYKGKYVGSEDPTDPGTYFMMDMNRIQEDVQLDEEARGEHGNIQMDNIGDPENPNVIVSGYGVLSVNFLRKEISKRLKELATRLERGDSDFLIRELTPGKGILKLFVDALDDVEAQMKTPKVKRKLTMLKKKKG